jgi:hypothetical protein
MLLRSQIASVAAVLFLTLPVAVRAQVRTTGSIVGTVKDPSAAVVPDAQIELTDIGTGNVATTKSSRDGGFVFPALQPGHYRLLATAGGFQPGTVPDLVVETARATNVTVSLEVAGVQEEVKVQAAAPIVDTTASTVSTTVRNEQIARLPLSGRDVLGFALLTPGTASSSDNRHSTYNGLPGGAINITLDGINNNSQRFRSGGTSFFTFAPLRLGAMEEVTTSTSGLTADAGAEGAVQVQFVTRRGTNQVHWEAFDQFRNDALNANSWLNSVRGLPKNRLRLNEYGANIGGPIIKGKLFYFVNFEQPIQPSQATFTRNILTPEAQQGVFRFTATDGSVRTANLLDIARANGFPGAVDPFMTAQFATINGTLSQGTLRSLDLRRQQLAFAVPQNPKNVYPTGRVDWQVNPSLAVHGILNLQWRDLARNPQFPGLTFVNAGFTSTYYILSTAADWTVRSTVFNQASFGIQSNYEQFNPGNTLDLYGAGRRVPFPATTTPLALTSALPTNDVMPQPRNNPVYNLIDTVTILKDKHTYTLGGSFRRTTMWQTSGGVAASGPAFNLGVASGDPVSSIFTATTMPGVRSTDLAAAQLLYAVLTGRLRSISGSNNVDESSHQYLAGPGTQREAQNVGGLYAQDQWRLTPRVTLNYGLRWEFTGAAYNTNGIYTSPTVENLYGPSKQLFQPGVLNGVLNPQIDLRPNPYHGSYVNPAPNAGFAWNPSSGGGVLGRILGNGKSTIRGSLGLNYYDEGLIAFENVATGNPGLTQSLSLVPNPPGSLLLSSRIPSVSGVPASFAFPLAQSLFTFTANDLASVNPDIKTPRVLNWNIGIQRELGRNAAIEVRYVGNHGFHLWRAYDINEVNIFENGFVQEFKNAQKNLDINTANGRTGFANNGLAGQVPLPLIETAFGPRGSQAALPSASGFTNGTFITDLQQGQAGALARDLAGSGGTSLYLCRMLGSTFSPCGNLGYDAPGPYPLNFFTVNPYAAGRALTLLNDDGHSRYDGLQMQFRQRYGVGLTMTANYTYSKATTNRYSDSPGASVNLITLRNGSLNEGPTIFDLRHAFQSYWTYDLPFGRGRHFGIGNPMLEQIAGGWTVSGILRVQSGRPFYLTSDRLTYNQNDAGVVLNGISVDDLQKMITLASGPNGTKLFVDPKLIGPDGRANPQYLSSPTTPGQLGQRVWLYGPGFWNLDLGIAKRFTVGLAYVNFEALFLDLFNTTTFLVGPGSNDLGFFVSINSTTFGQTTTTASGPRNIQLRLHIGW